MATVRRLLPWVAALALGVLGWQAMAPVWTQGLGMVALNADGQPGLWLAAAKAALVFCGVIITVRSAAIFSAAPRLRSLLSWGRILGPGFFVAAVILLVAMAGQPLRLWYLAAYREWGNPLVLGGAALAVCLPTLFLGPRKSRALESLSSLAGLAGFIVLARQLGGGLPVDQGRLVAPTPQEWLVLGFAAGCGLFAAWLVARGASGRRKRN